MTAAEESTKRRWRDLPPGKRAAIIVVAIVQNCLLIAALVDIRRRPVKKVRGDKRVWAAVSFVSWIGPIAWFTYGRKR
jgi:phospholipase D-like protein